MNQLFKEAKNGNTPVMVERIVADINEIVKQVQSPDWQQVKAEGKLIQKELRKMLLKYQLHRDQDLFDRAYGYIRQYY